MIKQDLNDTKSDIINNDIITTIKNTKAKNKVGKITKIIMIKY